MKNTKEQDEEPKFRYKVGQPKFNLVLWSIMTLGMMVFFGKFAVDCIVERNSEGLGWLVLAEVYGAWVLLETYSHIVVYKGLAVVNKIFWKKEYPLSIFGEPKEDADLLTIPRHTDWLPTYVFYDKNGKKLFKVYAKWDNAEKFYKEIKQRYSQVWNSQKKIQKRKL